MSNFIWKEHNIPDINDNDKLVFPSWVLPKKVYQLFYKDNKYWVIDWGSDKRSFYKGFEISMNQTEYFRNTKKEIELLLCEKLKVKEV